MTDIITRLRGPSPSIPAMRDAADEIARLREDYASSQEQVKALKEALAPFAKEAKEFIPTLPDTYMPCFAGDWRLGDLRRAAALLEKS